MKQRLFFLFKFYALLLLIFAFGKLLFMTYNGLEIHQAQGSDFFDVLIHGLPLDCATTGYLIAPLWLGLLLSLWWSFPLGKRLYQIYTAVVATLLALILLADTCLYEFWGIKLDGTIFNYIDSPKGATASVSTGYLIGVTIAFLVFSVLLFFAFRCIATRLQSMPTRIQTKGRGTLVFLLLGGLIFLGIRGGIGKSTANVGMVYYTDNTFLNHAAVNPAFSVISSAFKTKNYSKIHDYFPEEQRAAIFSSLGYNTQSIDSDTLLTMRRPNVLVILMEGCGATFVHAVDPEADPNVTPHLNQLAKEGILFSQCYANSFRTDRGTVCTFSGYPAFPDVSVMKMPSKCEKLSALSGALRQAGYATSFLYGGDINFTNTNGYLMATGYDKTYGDQTFTAEERLTHNWGVTDHITFDRLYQMVTTQPESQPWHIGFLTLASHEPWVVPYDRIPDDKVKNAMAYLDDCIGNFIQRFRQTPQWNNTLIVILPDHGIHYPAELTDVQTRTSHIPLIWTGGAVKEAREISTICNQTDLVATLLGQLGLPHDDFPFSRDVLSKSYTHPSAVHVWSEGIYYMDETGCSVLNLLTKPQSVFKEDPQPSVQRRDAANAFLQTCYDHLGSL